MPESIQNLLNQSKELFGKLDNTKKIILAGVIAAVIIGVIVLSSVSLEKNNVILFKDLQTKDFSEITKKLDALGYKYSSSDSSIVSVEADKRQEIITKLAQENLIPVGVQGWELFDMDKFTETQFDKDVKKYRALKGAIEKSLMTLKPIEKADVNIAFPDSTIFNDENKDYNQTKASVILHFVPGVDTLSKKEIKGIVNLISRGVPNLKPENVIVADSSGKNISDFDDNLDKENLELRIVQEKLRIAEIERVKKLVDIRSTLRWLNGEDRVEITRFEYEYNWDKVKYTQNEVSPVLAKADNPETPYDETELVENYSLKVSDKMTSEEFLGKGFTPQGPAGTEPNSPPGYMDLDYQKANYKKQEAISNYEFNRKVSEVKKQEWDIKKINLSVIIDGVWTKERNEDGYKWVRKYTPVSDEDLKLIKKNLESAIGFTKVRGDTVNVITLPKDRSAQFAAEDEELARQQAIKNAIIISLAILTFLILAILIYRAIKKEIARRRRLKEEELAARQQMMRDAALRVLEEGGADMELSPDEKMRKELLENAINLAKEKPEDVAQLLRTWLSEEEAS